MLTDSDAECLPILKWLLTQRNDRGAFEGIQDTIVGIEALAKFATRISTKDAESKITVDASNNTKTVFSINTDNASILQSQMV